jgi:hypothetical protein
MDAVMVCTSAVAHLPQQELEDWAIPWERRARGKRARQRVSALACQALILTKGRVCDMIIEPCFTYLLRLLSLDSHLRFLAAVGPWHSRAQCPRNHGCACCSSALCNLLQHSYDCL